MKLKDLIESNNTGLDAIKRAPIVDYDTGVRCLRIGDISNNRPFNEWGYTEVEDNNYSKFQLKTGDIIVARTGATIGVNKYIDKDYKSVYNNGLIRIRVKKENNPKYIYYILQSTNYKNFIKTISMGTSTQPNMQMNDLLNLEVPDFDKPKQDKIVEILGKIDDKIGLNNEINNNLYEFTNKLFEEKILNNQVKEHWTEYILSDISKMINGYSYKGNELTDKSDIGMATIKNFERTGGFKLDGFKDIIPEKAKDDHYVKPYEVLVACTDLTQNADIIGNAIMLLNTSDYNEIIMSMDLVKLVPITDFINNYMLYAIVNSKDFKDFALGYKSGTTVLHLNKNCFKEYTIKLPNEDILKDLSKVIEVNYKKISQIIEENKKLEQLRDILLPKLMNGDIDLENIDI